MNVRVMGVLFDGVTMDQAVDRALDLMASGRSAYVCTPNPDIVWDCRRDSSLRRAIAAADMTLPDGIGIVWASRVLGCPVPERVTGYDFLLALLEQLKGSVYLLGGRPGVAERAAAAIEARWPAVTVAGTHHGYFEDDEAVLADIRAAGADFIMVCLGSPRQELWMEANRPRLPHGLMTGLGGCIDVLAGDVARAPERWIRLNLEWLYRLLHQPGRIRRQIRLPLFALAVLAERMKNGAPKSPEP